MNARSILLGCLLLAPTTAFASGASTHFSLFVPPNDSNNGRHSAVTITAHADNTAVTVTDTAADGDTDDSTSATLNRGQSIVVRIRDGATNDGAGGKWDGDHIIIDATKPVTAMLSTRSEWQHDWVPAEGNTMRGNEFFVWSPRPNWDIDVVAYEDDTRVEIFEISTSATESSGVTTVSLPGDLAVRQMLNKGEDLLVTKQRSGTNVTRAGHTYRIVTSKPATVMYGSFYGRERDGGGYVPSEDGTTVGRHFYFPVPAGKWTPHEREIRIVAGDAASTVTLRGWSSSEGWTDIDTKVVPARGHLDYTGKSHVQVRNHEFFEIEATEPVNVFEGNWLETGRSGTSDMFTYVSALDGLGNSDVGTEFVAYVGPPGRENNVAGINGTYSHLYVTGETIPTTVTVKDVDTDGTLYDQTLVIDEVDEVVDFWISNAQYNSMNNTAMGIRPYVKIDATNPVSVGVANWNDNWLAFPSAALPASLKVEVTPPSSINCGVNENFTVTVTNDGAIQMDNVNLDIEGVGGCVPSVSNVAVGTLAAGASNQTVVQGNVACAGVTSGELVGIAATTTGDRNGDSKRFAATKTAATPVSEPLSVAILDVVGFGDKCAVEVGWTTDQDDGSPEYVVYRREFATGGTYAEVGRIPSVNPAMSGFVYGFRDEDVTQGTQYQYRVEAVDAMSQVALTGAGPTVVLPGLPFSDVPVATGDLEDDFEMVGVTIDDGLNDINSAIGVPAGYDIDRISVAYDGVNDALYLGVSAVGIFGDGDGDGDPNTTGAAATAAGLVDRARFGVDEQFAFVLDLDGTPGADTLVGIPFGGDLDYLNAAPLNQAVGAGTPTLAFDAKTEEQEAEVVVQLLNEPSASAPDLELVVYNISSLVGQSSLTDIGVNFHMHAPGITVETEWAPGQTLTVVSETDAIAPGCGIPAQEIHLGMFATFGNIGSGTPDFLFIPLGWTDTNSATVYETPPTPVPGSVIDSPTLFLGEKHVDVSGTIASGALELPGSSLRVRDDGVIEGNDFMHRVRIDWAYPAAMGDERYENLDLQTFRLFVLDCSATAIITQYGTSGVLHDDRIIGLADGSTQTLVDMNPALALASSGIGTFEVGGAIQNVHFATPADWVSDFGPTTSPSFTQMSFLDDITYVNTGDPPLSTEVYPLTQAGVQLNAGIWFVNHYLWTFANEGSTTIETRFIPGPDCGGSL